ncbi:hypothetical protein [Streptacidiphilus neutrinimicus]|nr:hypothetical protein [Streptacidiphilus neutrinimicus]
MPAAEVDVSVGLVRHLVRAGLPHAVGGQPADGGVGERAFRAPPAA